MPAPVSEKLLRLACLGALVALGLMTWQLFEPTVLPVIVAMSVGQVLGTASFGLYLLVVAADVRKSIVAPRREGADTKGRDASR